MKFRLERDVLAEAVAWVARSLPTRPSVPILHGLLLTAEDGHVAISAFDYETSARITVKADVVEPGRALVSGRLLADISRSLPNRPAELTANDSSMELVCGSARFTLQTMPLADYPSLPTMPEQAGAVPSDAFAAAVSQVVVAAGRDELLPVFTGVRLEIEDDNISLLATDRYRMALKELGWNPAQTQATAGALVPAKVLESAAKSMTSGETVQVSLASGGTGDGLIGFAGSGQAGEREITTRLLDGEFPKVRHLMNVQPLVTVRCSTGDLLAAVKRIGLVAERNTSLRMGLEEDRVILEAASGDQAQGVEAVEASIDRPGAEDGLKAAGFNPSYLTDALTSLDAPYVLFSFTQPGKPALLQGLSEIDGDPLPDYRHVIMLMRLPS